MTEDMSSGRLGRGLAALLGEAQSEDDALMQARAQRRVPIEFLTPNPRNPRQDFAEDDLNELTQSIKEKGILQPLLVRVLPQHADYYEIIAGERRWRAAQQAGLHEVPVFICEASDQETLELAIVENVQRADLNPVEEAEGYHRLVSEFGYSQNQVADIIGKSRSYVANSLRLLKLPDEVLLLLGHGELTVGHAKVLVAAEDPTKLARHIFEKGLSVRQAEELAYGTAGKKARNKLASFEKDADTRALEQSLSETLGVVVDVRFNKGETGELRLKFKSFEQLDHVVGKLV